MGISIQLFRLRIGTFTLGNQTKCRINDKGNGPKTPFLKIILLILLISSPVPHSRPTFNALPPRVEPGYLHPPLHPRLPLLYPHLDFMPVQQLLSCPSTTYEDLQQHSKSSHSRSQGQQPIQDVHLDSELKQWAFCTFLHWSYVSDNNKLVHTITGNRRLGYKLSFWNCRRRLVDISGRDTDKLVDIKKFIGKNKPHVFGVIESDLHSLASTRNCNTKLSTEDLKDKLKIEGYNIELPETWGLHGQARVLAYVSENLIYKIKPPDPTISDLPNITLEIGLGREKKTVVNIFYREWSSRIDGQSSQISQLERLNRQIHFWRSLYKLKKDIIILGDANLDAKRWNDADYNVNLKSLSNLLQEHLLEESSHQIVKEFTRSEMRNNSIQRSLIDHIYTNNPMKCEAVRVEALGDSDHMGVTVNKYSRELQCKPRAVLKRNYKDFNLENFLLDIHSSRINAEVQACQDLDTAALVFEERFKEILEFHAPI